MSKLEREIPMDRFCQLLSATSASFAVLAVLLASGIADAAGKRPNILFAISDDQSWPHASAYGYKAIQTPAFDRVAKSGVLFTGAFASSPGCSPCRASILTGRHTWQIEHAGTHASSFPRKYTVFPDLLEKAGYHIGTTGKSWGPGNYKVDGWSRNPAGPSFNKKTKKPPYKGIRSTDYAANFDEFLKLRQKDQPFFFWYGASEPHRGFGAGSGLKEGKKLEDVVVPSFLPDTDAIRSDILDYCVEIEWFDKHLGRMIEKLEAIGELENTLIVVTSDNGMAFPRAKANCYEYGIHMPLAICWPAKVKGGRTVDDLVQFIDFAPTFLQVAAAPVPDTYSGSSLLNVLQSDKQGLVDASRSSAYSARERHSSSRWNNLAYPQRALRTAQYLMIWNAKPDRWPAGTPQKYNGAKLGPMHGGYHDIDACPSLTFLIKNRDDPKIKKYFHLAVDKRPEWELFDIKKDPGCLNNLAGQSDVAKIDKQLRAQLQAYLKKTGDPRVLGNGDIWETYKRYSKIRKFPKPGQ